MEFEEKNKKIKIKLYKALVMSVLLYRCETWKMNKEDDKAMDGFQHKYLRRILNINWQDHISNKEVLKRANMERLSREVKKRRWKRTGHVLRQDDCTIAMTWAPEGRRKRRRLKTTWREEGER